MACCVCHDRLDLRLHAVEFTHHLCGSPKLDCLEELLPGVASTGPLRANTPREASPPVLDPSDPRGLTIMGYGKPYYCCFACPTLRGTLAPPDLQAPLP
jgi:hypothetical protein